MSRDLTSLALAASKADVARPVILARLDFASGVLRVTSAPFSLAAHGYTYSGVGALGRISAVAEGAELQSYSVQLALSGVPSELVSMALADQYQGREACLYLALLDEQHRVSGEPVLLYRGQMDTLDIELGKTATLTLTVQSRLADWPARLDRLLAERADMPFVWGQSDCVQLAKAGLEAVSADNWSAVEWPVYGSPHSAWKSLRALGYDDLPALATALLGPALPGPYARRGDLVAIACPH